MLSAHVGIYVGVENESEEVEGQKEEEEEAEDEVRNRVRLGGVSGKSRFGVRRWKLTTIPRDCARDRSAGVRLISVGEVT